MIIQKTLTEKINLFEYPLLILSYLVLSNQSHLILNILIDIFHSDTFYLHLAFKYVKTF